MKLPIGLARVTSLNAITVRLTSLARTAGSTMSLVEGDIVWINGPSNAGFTLTRSKHDLLKNKQFYLNDLIKPYLIGITDDEALKLYMKGEMAQIAAELEAYKAIKPTYKGIKPGDTVKVTITMEVPVETVEVADYNGPYPVQFTEDWATYIRSCLNRAVTDPGWLNACNALGHTTVEKSTN